MHKHQFEANERTNDGKRRNGRRAEWSVSMIFVHSFVQSCVGGQQSVNADYHIKFNDSKTHSHLRRATHFKYYFIMHSMPKWCDLIPPRANVHFLRIWLCGLLKLPVVSSSVDLFPSLTMACSCYVHDEWPRAKMYRTHYLWTGRIDIIIIVSVFTTWIMYQLLNLLKYWNS